MIKKDSSEKIKSLTIKDSTVCIGNKLNKNRKCITYKEMKFEANKIYQLSGSNGCGKSVLLKSLMELIDATKPNIETNHDWKYWYCDTSDLNIFGITPRKVLTGIDRVFDVDKLKFKTKLDDSMSNFSKGEMSKLKLLTLSKKHNFIVFDESLHHLDSESVEYVVSVIKTLKDVIIIFVQHDKELFFKNVINYNIEKDYSSTPTKKEVKDLD